MTLFLILVIVAIGLGLIGAVAEGLFYLLIIGIVVFIGAWCTWSCTSGVPAGTIARSAETSPGLRVPAYGQRCGGEGRRSSSPARRTGCGRCAS
ncbi:hypothetical protein [Streptomyces sp. NPDC090131]|uniref:hypothetical protein n=1 Tax=Streptomyces sp. NPDC090131 TaxID=3365954 RepID=UPI00382368C3